MQAYIPPPPESLPSAPVKATPRSIESAQYSMTKWVGSGFLTADIYNHIQLMRLATKLPQANRKKLAWKKGPDCMLGFGTLGQKLIPRVAMEVSFSQPYEDLITDVCV